MQTVYELCPTFPPWPSFHVENIVFLTHERCKHNRAHKNKHCHHHRHRHHRSSIMNVYFDLPADHAGVEAQLVTLAWMSAGTWSSTGLSRGACHLQRDHSSSSEGSFGSTTTGLLSCTKPLDSYIRFGWTKALVLGVVLQLFFMCATSLN